MNWQSLKSALKERIEDFVVFVVSLRRKSTKFANLADFSMHLKTRCFTRTSFYFFLIARRVREVCAMQHTITFPTNH